MSGSDAETAETTAGDAIGQRQTPFDLIGGVEPIRRIVDRFYDLMDDDPAYARLRAIHAPDLSPMRDSLTGFLTGWMGGPRDWFEHGKCVMSAHAGIAIDASLRDQWLDAMARATGEEVDDDVLRTTLIDAFTRMGHAMTRR